MTDKVQKIREEVKRLKSNLIYGACSSQIAMETHCKEEAYNEVLAILDAMQEESVSEDLEEAIDTYLATYFGNEREKQDWSFLKKMAIYFAKWQKQNLWKSAEGSDLPIFDREVIVLTQPYPLKDSEYAVYFAHRPDPKGWDGKSLTTGKVEHYAPKTYGKGGWNIPDVKYWLDCSMPKEIEL